MRTSDRPSSQPFYRLIELRRSARERLSAGSVKHWTPFQRLALILWLIVLGGVGGRVALSQPTSQSVIPIYRGASVRWLAQEDLYAIYHLRNGEDVFRYPPVFALLFVPIGLIPHHLAGFVWRAISAAFLLTGLGLWARRGLLLNPGQQGILFAFAAVLSISSLNNGQLNTLVLGLLLHGTVAAIGCRGKLAGVCLAATTAIKVYPIAVALLLSSVDPRRILPTFLLGLGALTALPFLFAQPEFVAGQYVSFVQSVRADDRHFNGHPHPPRDFFWLLKAYFVPPSAETYAIIVLAVALAMAAFVLVTAYVRRDARIAAILAFDFGCIWMTVFGPATEPATYSLLAATAAALVVSCWHSRAQLTLALLAYGLLVSPIIRDFFPNGRVFHELGTQPLGGLLALGLIIWRQLGNFGCPSEQPGDMILVCEPSPLNLSARSRP